MARILLLSRPHREMFLAKTLLTGSGGTSVFPVLSRHFMQTGEISALYYVNLTPKCQCSYIVAVISNQGGISLKSDSKTVKSDQKRLSEFKAKVTSVFSQLDFPISIYAGTSRDKFRKPRTGMWHELLEDNDLDVGEGIDLEDSIFVGDAAGRPARESIKQDHSSSDR